MIAGRFRGHPIISDQVDAAQLAVIWRELSRVLEHDIPGDVTEFGCYAGTTSLFIRRLLDETGYSDSKQLHVYDSFEGLPAKRPQDASSAGDAFVAGELAVTKRQLLTHFRQAGLRAPIVHKGWFDRLNEHEVPERLCFAFLDGDFYDSIMDSFVLVWPRLQPGACLVIDDYSREALPGVARAIHDYFVSRNQTVPTIRTEHNLGIIQL